MEQFEVAPLPRRRMTGAERRATILAAAIAEFSRVGFHGATTASIARAAACSEPTLYKHVRDKRALLLACLQETEDAVERELQRIIALPDALAEMTRFSTSSTEYRDMLRLRLLCTSLADDAEVRSFLQTAVDRMERRMTASIEKQRADGFDTLDEAGLATWLWLGLSFAAYEELALHGEEAFTGAVERRTRIFQRTLRTNAVNGPVTDDD